MLDDDKLLFFGLSVHAIIGARSVGGVDGVVRIIDILFAECFHGLMKISIIITNLSYLNTYSYKVKIGSYLLGNKIAG